MLFGLAIEFVMRAAVDRCSSCLTLISRRSLRYPEVKLADLDYTDDIALFEESETNMTEITETTRATAEKLGLQMRFKKTEILPIQYQCSKTTPAVPLRNEGIIKVVDHFEYPGAYSSAEGFNAKEINHRIGKAWGTFRELDMVWKDLFINLSTKMKFYNAFVLSTLLLLPNAGVSQKEMKPTRCLRHAMPT